MVSIKPNNQIIEKEQGFITDVPDSDRFKDISFIIYQQNSKLYQKLLVSNKNDSLNKVERNISTTPEIFNAKTSVNKSNPQSSVCNII
jgi:hypothetical protein